MKNLKNDVLNWKNEMEGNLNEVTQYGCQSGIVGHLISYHDTTNYFNQYKDEINELLQETMLENEADCPSDILGDWDTNDPLAFDTHNQNLLAWFGFEETAFRLLDDEE